VKVNMMPAGLLQYARCYQLAVGISAAHQSKAAPALSAAARSSLLVCRRVIGEKLLHRGTAEKWDQRFESAFLQRRVCELTVPLRMLVKPSRPDRKRGGKRVRKPEADLALDQFDHGGLARRRRRAADLAGFCARPSAQGVGSYGHTLVTSGIYGVIRHPSYLGLLVNSLGWALAFRSGVGVLLAALLIPPLVARIRAEERLLRSQFGEYEVYRSRTSRLIPGVY
jgi:hypothetical protein